MVGMDWTAARHIAIWTAAIITVALALWILLAGPIHALYRAIYYFVN